MFIALLPALACRPEPVPPGQPDSERDSFTPGASDHTYSCARLRSEILSDFPFRSFGDTTDPQVGTISVPAGVGPFPAVVMVHGGAFANGTPEEFLPWADALHDHGFASFSIEYRLVCTGSSQPERCTYPQGSVAYPGPVDDVRCAVRWLRAHADEFCIDPARIALMGNSSGGYLATFVGLTGDGEPDEGHCGDLGDTSDAVNGVVDYYGISDWNQLVYDRANDQGLIASEIHFLGTDCIATEDREGRCSDASIVPRVDAGDPPILLLHGTDDLVLPIAQSRALYQAVVRAGGTAQAIEYEGVEHGWAFDFRLPEAVEAREASLAWLAALPPR